MHDIITFGSASQDIFIKSKSFQEVSGRFVAGKGICFPLGSKIDIDEIYFSSGGGGANTAVTFANQGFKVAYLGVVGEDLAGRKIIKELKERGVATELISTIKDKPTNHSIILSVGGERTILVYRGASNFLSDEDISWQKLKTAKWFYIAPLSGKAALIFGKLVDSAKKNNIKVVANLGNSQIKLPAKILHPILKKIDILSLNREEASLLTGIPYQKEKEIFKKLDKLIAGIVIMGRDKEGVIVSDGKYLYQAKPPKIKVVDRTGAGDALGSGFVSGFIKSNGDIIEAIQLGVANSVSCIQKMGSQNGLLKVGQSFPKVKVTKTIIAHSP